MPLDIIDRSLGEGQGLGAGITHLSEPGAVSRNLFSRPGHFARLWSQCSLSSGSLLCPTAMTYVSCLGNLRGATGQRGGQSETRRPSAECLAPGRGEEEIRIWVMGTKEAPKSLNRPEVQRGAQVALSAVVKGTRLPVYEYKKPRLGLESQKQHSRGAPLSRRVEWPRSWAQWSSPHRKKRLRAWALK